MEYLYGIVLFVFGIVLGSFYNVVCYRLPLKKSLIKPGSHCPKCKKPLSFWELIPLFSYIFQRGKCKKCGEKISAIYPLVELSTGILFLISYLIFGLNLELVISLIFVSLVVIVFVTDIKEMIVLDEVIGISLVFLIIIRLIIGYNWLDLTLDLIIPFLLMFLIKIFGDHCFKKESMGGGDIKLMPVFGVLLGYKTAFIVIGFGAFLAFPIALLFLFIKKQRIIPFGPFLSLAALILYFTQVDFEKIVTWLVMLGG